MSNRVTVNITARDLTRTALMQMRRNFRSLGQDMDRLIGRRTRANFDRLGQSIRATRRDLGNLRGNIPDAEFFRLDAAMRQAQRTMGRGFRRVGDTQIARIAAQVRQVQDAFRDLDETGQIRIRVDTSGLRRADALLAAWRRDQARNAVRIPVNPDVHSGRFRRILTRTLTSPIRTAGSFLGGVLSDGLGQGIIGAFKTAGPIGMTILAGIIAASASLLGAALAGALVFSLGGIVAGIGIAIAAQSKEVKKAWGDTMGEIKDLFSEAAKPMLPVIEEARKRLLSLARDWAPGFEQVLLSMQGPLNKFLGHFDSGLRRLMDNAGPDLAEGFNVFLEAFGPQFEDMLAGLGDSLGALGRTVRDNSTEIAAAFTMIISLITTVIDIVNFLANAWSDGMHVMIGAVAAVQDALATLVEGVFFGFDKMLGAIQTVAEFLPGGLGDAIGQARERFNEMGDGVVASMRRGADGIRGLSDAIKRQNAGNKITADIESLKAKVEAAKAKLQTVTDKKTRAKIQGNIDDLTAKLRAAEGKLAAFNGSVATAYIITYSKTYKSVHDIVKATGGNVGTAATGGIRSNMVLVGEQGPEMVDLAPGSHVRSNPDSRRLAGGGGGASGEPIVILLDVGGDRLAEIMVDPLRRTVSRRGGVQATFGKL